MPARIDRGEKEVLRHLWRGVRQLWRGGETAFHSFMLNVGSFHRIIWPQLGCGLKYRFSGVLHC